MRTGYLFILFLLFNFRGFAQNIPELTSDKQYCFHFADLSFSINPEYGGRVSSFCIGGSEVLEKQDSIEHDNWGGTFWTSPQSVWNWPPPETLNKAAYKVQIQENNLTLISEENTGIPNCIFGKDFSIGTADTSISITYTIHNPAENAQSFAPWQVVRVPAGGLCFFPSGEGKMHGDLRKLSKKKEGITWFRYQNDKIPDGIPKLFSDGKEGWMAFVNDQGILLAFKFKDIPKEKAAPGEAEIELYTNPNKVYTELETQGAFQSIAAHSSLSWKIKWYIRRLPEGMGYKTANDALVAYVRSIIN